LLAPATVLLLVLLMFIGASPGSTGGGIKTTSALTLLLFLQSGLRQKKNIKLLGRNLPIDLVQRVQLIFLASVAMVSTAVFLITLAEGGRFPLVRIFFEVVSAFATVGLSLGITAQLSTFSKFVIIVTMYVGRVGIINLFFTFQKEQFVPSFEYPEERVMV
jgi:Trk-type K+ transport system membrane component